MVYKVFVNDKPIVLSDQVATDIDYEFALLQDVRIAELLHKLRNTQAKGYYIYHANLTSLWEKFKTYFEVIVAAGGLVLKEEKAILIHRNDRWDLPKGKWEKGETHEQTAAREVEEECGISRLEIVSPLQTTYHIFYENNINKLKITHWYLMHATSDEIPIPQKEEGIERASYIPIEDIPALYTAMYANIKDLLAHYFKTNNL